MNPLEYLPEEEIQTLMQVYYLIMMALFFIDFLYSLMYSGGDIFYLALFDIVLCLFVAVTFDKSSLKNKIIVFFLLPFGSMTFVLFGFSFVSLLDIVHVPILIYFIFIYYRNFRDYTESNGLGLTIILLFATIFLSFLFTMVAENQNPLNALVMVSNAFTSNGYAVLGHSVVGKLNSLLLVWGGYIISGVGTATLTAAIMLKYFYNRIDELERLIQEEDDEYE